MTHTRYWQIQGHKRCSSACHSRTCNPTRKALRHELNATEISAGQRTETETPSHGAAATPRLLVPPQRPYRIRDRAETGLVTCVSCNFDDKADLGGETRHSPATNQEPAEDTIRKSSLRAAAKKLSSNRLARMSTNAR